MKPTQLKKQKASQPAQLPRPPRYITEQPMGVRTQEKDKEALQMAVDAYQELIEKPQQDPGSKDPTVAVDPFAAVVGPCPSGTKSDQGSSSKGNEHEQSESSDELDEELAYILNVYQPEVKVNLEQIYPPRPDVMFPMDSMFRGNWPRTDDPAPGATQYSWSTIGFPADRGIDLEDYEGDTHIHRREPAIADLAWDIANIREMQADEIADGGIVETHEERGRTIEIFRVQGRKVAKIAFGDCSVLDDDSEPYNRCQVAKAFEHELDSAVGSPPDLAVVQRVAARILLARRGQIGGRSLDYWRRATDLAQQELDKNPDLEATVREELKDNNDDKAFTMMLRLVRESMTTKLANPYHQSKRDQYAVDNGLFYRVDAEIVMVLDKANNVIAFQLSNAFRTFPKQNIQDEVTKSIDLYSTLQPAPVPDMTRHGLHWVDWLVAHPEFDCRVPQSDPRTAKAGVYRFGLTSSIGDPQGINGPMVAKDTWIHIFNVVTVRRQLRTLRFTALGACSEVSSFLFELLDPQLVRKYREVAATASVRLDNVPFETRRRDRDIFTHWAVELNIMANDHKNRSDWHHGLSSLIPLGDFEGGDLLLRDLGLQIVSKPGSVQLLRGRELSHSTSKWTGKQRFVVAGATHDSVRRWVLREKGSPVSGAAPSSSMDSDVEVEQEDVVPENQEAERMSWEGGDYSWHARPGGADDSTDTSADDRWDTSSASDRPRGRITRTRRAVSGAGAEALGAECGSDADVEDNGDDAIALAVALRRHQIN